MVKNKKFEINLVEEGLENMTLEEYEKERQKIVDKMEEDSNNSSIFILNKRRIIILIIWASFYKLFVNWGFGMV